jgi:hypothetical protein
MNWSCQGGKSLGEISSYFFLSAGLMTWAAFGDMSKNSVLSAAAAHL